jgi:hypothetical protein
MFWISARICRNCVFYGELHRIFPTSEKFIPCPISTTVPSRALELFKSAPFLIVLQCGAYLTSANAPDSITVANIEQRSHNNNSRPLFFLHTTRLRHPSHHSSSYVIILPKSDLHIQGCDENLITIGNKPVSPQSLISTSDQRVFVPQAFVVVTRFVTGDLVHFLQCRAPCFNNS